MGPERVIAIVHYPHRLDLPWAPGTKVIDFHAMRAREALMGMTGGLA